MHKEESIIKQHASKVASPAFSYSSDSWLLINGKVYMNCDACLCNVETVP